MRPEIASIENSARSCSLCAIPVSLGGPNEVFPAAKSGSIVTFYATGWQPSFSPLANGQVATSAQDRCQGTCQAGSNATVLYGGAAPDIVTGVSQFNVLLGNSSANPGVFRFAIIVSNVVSVSPAVNQTFASEFVWIAP